MVYAFVTVYNPKENVKENIFEISQQVDKIFILDNSSNSNKDMFSFIQNSIYIFNNENLGISSAFNTPLKSTSFDDNDFLIFFDQDSTIKTNHIQKLIEEFIKIERCGYNIGALGPVFFNKSNNSLEITKIKEQIVEDSNIYIVNKLITSSMITKYRFIKQINFWNDHVFLDYADWDFCWRIKMHKLKCFLTTNVILEHEIGIGEKKVGPISLRLASPIRDYYKIRDSLYLLFRRYTPTKIKCVFLFNLLFLWIVNLFFLDKKKERLYYHFKGIVDFTRGKKGAFKN